MANIVEFFIRLKDQGSSVVQRFAANGERAFSRLSNRVSSFASQFTRVGASVDQLNRRIDDLTRTRNMSVDSSQIRRINRELAELERRRDRLTNAGSNGGGGWRSAVGAGLVFGGLGVAAALGGQAIDRGIERSMAGTSFEVMAGKSMGDNLHKSLLSFASDTIYGNEVFKEAQTMLGFGVKAQNVLPSMRMLGDVAMGNTQRMEGLVLAFSNTAAAGKLMGQDLLQYINAGFNPLQAINQKTGRSMADLKKDMEKSKITFKDVVDAFQYATGPMGRFHNGMKRMGETPAGKWIAFKGSLEAFSGTVGTKILPLLGGVATLLNGLLGNEPLLYGIAAAIGAMTAAWALYTAWTQRAAIWQGILLVAAYWPLAVIGLLAGAVTYLTLKYDNWGKSMRMLWSTAKNVGEGTLTIFKDMAQGIGFAFEWLWYKLKGFFQYLGQLAENVGKAFQLAVKLDFAGAKKALSAEITTDASVTLSKLSQDWSKNHALNTGIIQRAFDEKQIKGLDFSTKGSGKSVGKSAMDWMTGKLDMNGLTAGNTPAGVTDAAKGIAGGGVRNITINIAKQGVDHVTINTTNMRESVADIERMFIEMFNQVVNSANAVIPAN